MGCIPSKPAADMKAAARTPRQRRSSSDRTNKKRSSASGRTAIAASAASPIASSNTVTTAALPITTSITPVITAVQPHQKRIVIAGGGVIGKVFAKMFQDQNYPCTVIEPRKPTRQGDLQCSIVSKIEQVANIKIDHKDHAIKDVEIGLQQHLGPMVTIVEGEFVDVVPGGVLVRETAKPKKAANDLKEEDSKQDSSLTAIQCDFLIDCTGYKRVALKAFNQKKGTPKFDIVPQPLLPHENYVYAHILLEPTNGNAGPAQQEVIVNFFGLIFRAMIPMPANNIEAKFDSTGSPEPIRYAQAYSALRKRFAWDKQSMPFAIIHGTPKAEKYSFNLFAQAPKNLRPDQLFDYLNFIVQYRTEGMATIRFVESRSVFAAKHEASYFPIDSRYVPQPYVQIDGYPLMLHAGDASLNLPFLTGASLNTGIDRLVLLRDCLSLDSKKGTINFDAKKYESEYTRLLKEHCKISSTHPNLTILEKSRVKGEESFNSVAADAVEDMGAVLDEKSLLKINPRENHDDMNLFSTNLRKLCDAFLVLDDAHPHKKIMENWLFSMSYACAQYAEELIKNKHFLDARKFLADAVEINILYLQLKYPVALAQQINRLIDICEALADKDYASNLTHFALGIRSICPELQTNSTQTASDSKATETTSLTSSAPLQTQGFFANNFKLIATEVKKDLINPSFLNKHGLM